MNQIHPPAFFSYVSDLLFTHFIKGHISLQCEQTIGKKNFVDIIIMMNTAKCTSNWARNWASTGELLCHTRIFYLRKPSYPVTLKTCLKSKGHLQEYDVWTRSDKMRHSDRKKCKPGLRTWARGFVSIFACVYLQWFVRHGCEYDGVGVCQSIDPEDSQWTCHKKTT